MCTLEFWFDFLLCSLFFCKWGQCFEALSAFFWFHLPMCLVFFPMFPQFHSSGFPLQILTCLRWGMVRWCVFGVLYVPFLPHKMGENNPVPRFYYKHQEWQTEGKTKSLVIVVLTFLPLLKNLVLSFESGKWLQEKSHFCQGQTGEPAVLTKL